MQIEALFAGGANTTPYSSACPIARKEGVNVVQQVVHQRGIENVAPDELKKITVHNRVEVAAVSGVGPGVQNDDGGFGETWKPVFDGFMKEIGVDKPGSIGKK